MPWNASINVIGRCECVWTDSHDKIKAVTVQAIAKAQGTRDTCDLVLETGVTAHGSPSRVMRERRYVHYCKSQKTLKQRLPFKITVGEW